MFSKTWAYVMSLSAQCHTGDQARLHLRQLVDGKERGRVFNQRALLRLVPAHQAIDATINEQNPVNGKMLDEEPIVIEQGPAPVL